MNAQTTFAAMRAIIEAPGYPLLQHYRDADFYKCDRLHLERTCAQGGSYLWIVRSAGTHLVQLGLHPKIHSEGHAVLELGGEMDIFHVTGRGVQRISRQTALVLLGRLDYSVNGSTVLRGEELLAQISVQLPPWHAPRFAGVVDYKTSPADRSLSLRDLLALIAIGQCEVIQLSQSLFTPTDCIRVNGDDIQKLVEERRGYRGDAASDEPARSPGGLHATVDVYSTERAAA